MSVLKVSNLTKTFTSGLWPFKTQQSYTAVNDISFELGRGEILGLLGPNGAGKTTTIQMLLGTLTPSSGSITYFGDDFARHRVASLRRIGYASGYDKLPARLTVMDNLDVIGRIYGIHQPQCAQQIEKLLKFFGIWDKRDASTGSLSAGQATRGIELAFVVTWLLLLFSGAYYPISVLPAWGQAISACIPMSYIFEGARNYVMNQQDPTMYLLKRYAMAIPYAIIAMTGFVYFFNRSKRKGLARLVE